MAPIKLGVIGLSSTGWATTTLIPPLLTEPLSSKYTITAICTSSAESAAASVKKYSDLVGHEIKAYHGENGHKEIAADPNVDMVVVSVRVPKHKHALMPAIEAGKDVFVEWCIGNGLKEATEIVVAAKAKGIRTMVGIQARQAPSIRKLKELVEAGKIGRILSTSIIMTIPAEVAFWGPQIRSTNHETALADKGQTMLDIGIGHFLSGVHYALGEFISVTATGAVRFPVATEVNAEGERTGRTITQTGWDQVAFSGILKESGAVVSLHCRGGLKKVPGGKDFLWTIDGEEGSISIECDSAFLQIYDSKLYLNGELVETPAIHSPGMIASAWAEFASGPDGIYADFEDGLKLHRVLDAVKRSIEEGRRIELV